MPEVAAMLKAIDASGGQKNCCGEGISGVRKARSDEAEGGGEENPGFNRGDGDLL
jgi:hypothetical protein